MGKRLTTDEFIRKAKQLHNGKYDYSQSVYVNSRTKLTILCPMHGPFEQLPTSHLAGNGCPVCARDWSDEHRENLRKSSRKSRGMTTEQWIAKARLVHGDMYDYSQTVYVNQRTGVVIICPKHGVFTQNADSHIRGCGCRLCGYESENHKFNHEWSDSQRAKIAETCRERYGAGRYLDSDEGKEKMLKIRSSPEFRAKMRRIISSEDVQAKTRATCRDTYGVDSAMMLPEIVDKVDESKRRNGTWSTSRPEERMYLMLCDRFGEHDVIRQYKESRYPFHCDFYIRSLDLFVELNATWLHGGHWFDEFDECDLRLLDKWRRKLADGKRFYSVAIDVWTRRDVRKRRCAIENNLNYVVFWMNDLSDFKRWLGLDTLVLNNVLNQDMGHSV